MPHYSLYVSLEYTFKDRSVVMWVEKWSIQKQLLIESEVMLTCAVELTQGIAVAHDQK